MVTKEGATLSDLAIQAQVSLLQKNRQKPEEFTDRKNNVFDDKTKVDSEVKEQDLPVVQEARDKIVQAKEQGLIASKELNPFGEGLTAITMYLFGDTHQTGSNPENSIIYRNQFPYKIIEGLLNMPRRKVGESIFRKMLGKDFEDWMLKKKPIMQADSFRITLDAIFDRIKTHSYSQDSSVNHPHIVVDLGDRGDTESNMGDVALNAVEHIDRLQQFVGTVKDKFPVMAAFLAGNHDGDINNHGFESERFQRELFGKPIFLQDVGNYVVLSLNTNLYSSFWRYQVTLERQKFDEIKKKSNEVPAEKLPSEIVKQIKRYEDFFKTLDDEEKRQDELIQKATESGKKIAILAHEEDQVLNNLPLDKMKVTHIVAAHLHKAVQKDLKQTNSDGDKIKLVRVGISEALIDEPKPEELDNKGNLIPQSGRIDPSGISLPQSYELHIDGDDLDVKILEIKDDAPNMADLY